MRRIRYLLMFVFFGFVKYLPDIFPFISIRVFVYRLFGNKIGREARILGGSQVLGGRLIVGPEVFVNRCCYFDLTEAIYIGSKVTIGHGVVFVTADHEIGPKERRAGRVVARPITIGDGVWIGSNVLILPGSYIGAGSVIAAGSIVKGSFDEDILIAGVPAKTKRNLI